MDDIASLALTFDILARDKASSQFKKVGDAAEDAGKRGSTSIGSLSGALKGVGAALAGSAIVAGLGKTISAASDLNETVNKSNVIFGANSRQIQKWASGASRNLGLSKGAALDAAASFGNMFTQLGFTGAAATDMSKQVVQLSADLGSFNNLPTAEVADMMSAAFRGEYDSLQRLIPNINAARVEQEAMAITGKANAKELTAQEKATAVLAIVQRDGAAAAGDFAKTSDGLANSTKIAAAQFEDLQASIGQKFLPVAEGAMQFLSGTAIPALEGVLGAAAGVANAFMDLPGPVKAAAGAAVLWAVAGDRIMGAWGKVSPAFSGLRGTMSAFGEALSYARANGDGLTTVLKSAGSYAGGQALAAFKSLGRAIGPELAVGVAIGGITAFISEMKRLTSASADAEAATKGLADALTLTDEAADMKSARQAIENTEGLVAALADVGVNADLAIDGLLGNRQAQDEVTAALQNYLTTTRRGQAPQTEEQQRVRQAIENYIQLATSYDNAAGSARYFGGQAEETAGQTEGVATAAESAAEEVRALKDRLDDLTGKTISAMEAEANLQGILLDAADAMDGLDGSVTGANGKLDLHSEKGQAAFETLVDLRDASNDVIDSMVEQGASTDEVARKDQKLRETFIKTAMQMGISKKEAKRLADQILGIPEERNTEITSNADAVRERMGLLQREITDLHGKTVTITVAADDKALALFRDFNGVNRQYSPGRAQGGPIFGPGGPTDDKAGLFRLSDGEYVVRASSVDKYGLSFMDALNRGNIEHFAQGGRITVDFNSNSLNDTISGILRETGEAASRSGTPGSGSIGGGWQSIYNWVKARIPQARINSTYRPGDPGYHGLGKAIDFGYGSGPGGMGSAGLALINRTLHDGIGRNLAELIYDGYGDDRPDLKNGRPLTYSYGTQLEHRNHVHAAVYDSGGILPPGYTMAYNGTGRNEHVVTGGSEMRIVGDLTVNGLDGHIDARIVDFATATADRGAY